MPLIIEPYYLIWKEKLREFKEEMKRIWGKKEDEL